MPDTEQRFEPYWFGKEFKIIEPKPWDVVDMGADLPKQPFPELSCLCQQNPIV